MEIKHTQGRWYYQEGADEYTHIVRTDRGKGFETCFICQLPQGSKNSRANAKLIAAAPDLLKELSIMVECWDKDVFTDVDIECARIAIKKATT